MNHANTVICTARSRHSLLPAVSYSAPAAWRVREAGEYYIPDVLATRAPRRREPSWSLPSNVCTRRIT
jgi:hypothetical protein